MDSPLLLTIFAGVAVFVLGQFFLRLVLDPIVSLKESLGVVSHLFLLNQAKITNGIGSPDIQKEILMSSASLLAKKQAIPFYKLFSFMFRLPTENDLIKGCGLLNLISSELEIMNAKPLDIKASISFTITRNMSQIEKLLNIRVTYG